MPMPPQERGMGCGHPPDPCHRLRDDAATLPRLSARRASAEIILGGRGATSQPRGASAATHTIARMSVEHELSQMLSLSALDMEARVKEHLGDDAPSGDHALIALHEIFVPIIAKHHEALLLLAREIDRLSGG